MTMRRLRALGRAGLLLLAFAMPAGAEEDGAAVMADGPDLDELIAIARRLNPDLAVAALESDAAAAKVAGADSLPDPKLIWQPMDIPRSDSTYLPSRLPRTDKLFVQQEFPLWGKRDLRREIALADSRKAVLLQQVAENEVVARVKAAYAEYHQIHQVMDLDRELLPRVAAVARQAAARYAQGVGGQQEATSAEIERTQLANELLTLDAERRKAKVRLNTLLGREPAAPISEMPHLRPVPLSIDLARLTDRALAANPELRADDHAIDSAEHGVALAEKGWYPDIAVTVGGVEAMGRFDGYEAMLEVNIPLRGGLRDADIGQAKAMAGVARARRQAKQLEIGNALNDAWWSLEAARQLEKNFADSALPQARLGFESAARAYALGKGDFIMVLTAEQQWRKTHLDGLRAELEQQIRLAELEKLVGGEL